MKKIFAAIILLVGAQAMAEVALQDDEKQYWGKDHSVSIEGHSGRGQLDLKTNSTKRLTVRGANVGVATENPAATLDVNGNAQFGSGSTKSTFTATGALQMASGASLTIDDLESTDDTTVGDDLTVTDDTALNGDTTIGNAGVDTLTLNAGSVTIRELSSAVWIATATNANNPLLRLDGANNRVGIMNASPGVALDVTGAGTFSGALTGNGNVVVGDAGVDTLTLNAGSVTIRELQSAVWIATATNANSPILRMDGLNRRLGINQANPQGVIHASSGTVYIDGDISPSFQIGGSTLVVRGDGQVQIGDSGGSIANGTLFIKNAGGTSATDNLLQIQTTGGGGIGRYFGIDTTNKYMYDRMNDDATYGWAWQNASGTNRLMTLRRDGSSRVRLGVNDEAPAATLDIVSNETPTGYVLYVSSQNEGAMLAVRGNGDVEIGAASTISTFTATGQLRMQLTAKQTIAAGNTIAADACGGIKMITAGGAVTTDTTNTFTAPAVSNRGCCMDVVVDTASGGAITLDNNANFKSAGAADVVLGANDSARVCSNGSLWYQIGDTGNN